MSVNYLNRVVARRRNGLDDVQTGLQVGQQVGKLIGGLAGAIHSSQQDAAANKLMTSQAQSGANAQAAADPDPDPLPDSSDNLSPTAANDPSGVQDTAPFTGGVAGMKLAQQMQKEQLSTQMAQAKLADQLASNDNTGIYAKRATPAPKGLTVSGNKPWDSSGSGGITTSAPKGAKQPKYAAGTGDFENDPGTDDAGQIKTDFEALHPGLYGKFMNAKTDDSGNYVIPGKGQGQVDPNTGEATPPPPEAVIPKAEGDIYTQRINAYKRKAGIPYTANLNGQGTQDNPVPLASKLQARSLPPGTWVQDPASGQKFMISRRQAQ